MKGLCKRAGVKDVGFHGLRRFFASLLADKHKESMPTIQKLLGHASVSVTLDVYSSVLPGISRQATEALATSFVQ